MPETEARPRRFIKVLSRDRDYMLASVYRGKWQEWWMPVATCVDAVEWSVCESVWTATNAVWSESVRLTNEWVSELLLMCFRRSTRLLMTCLRSSSPCQPLTASLVSVTTSSLSSTFTSDGLYWQPQQLLLLVWQAPLGVCSAKYRHQSPEWMILSHFVVLRWISIKNISLLLSFSIASFRERLLDFRSRWIDFIHIVRGHPGGLVQFSKGQAVWSWDALPRVLSSNLIPFWILLSCLSTSLQPP